MKNRNLNNHNDWETPRYILNDVDILLGTTDWFDPCPLGHNVNNWNGLDIEWKKYNFCNPPYSRALKEAFIHKAYNESKLGRTTVMLLPVSTSTKIFHDIILPNADIKFIRGRIKFIGVNTFGEKVENKCGMHDSMFVIFKGC